MFPAAENEKDTGFGRLYSTLEQLHLQNSFPQPRSKSRYLLGRVKPIATGGKPAKCLKFINL